MPRELLPDRRPSISVDLEYGGLVYQVSVGFYPDGRVGEVFCHGAKVGSGMHGLLDDACVVMSLLLQHGVTPDVLQKSLGGEPADRRESASIIGALAAMMGDL